MIYLLQLEWKKWRKNITFRLMMLSYFILLPTVLLLGKRIPELPPPIGTNEALFIFPTIWIYLGYVAHIVAFFLFGFLTIIIITSEYSYKTLRQNIITGLDRKTFFYSKFSFILAISFIATLYFILCGLVIGYVHTDLVKVQKVFQHSDYFYRFFLLCLGYMTLAAVIAFFVKRTGLALFLYFGYVIGELVLRWGIHYNFFRHESMHYYPQNAIEDLIPFPFSNMADSFLKENGFNLFLSPNEAMVTTIIYTSLFLYFIYRYLQKANL